LLSGFIYPVILAWTWGQGWLFEKGFVDFAGTGVIHLVAGTAGFWGAWIVGERRAKIRDRENHKSLRPKVRINQALRDQLAAPNADYSSIA
jgi:ammonia channel protein AmtB